MSATMTLTVGTTRHQRRQILDASGAAFDPTTNPTPFDSSDTLACKVWAGDSLQTLATPTVTWVDVPTAVIQISFAASDTSSLPPGAYSYIVEATRSGATGKIDEGTILLEAAPSVSAVTVTDLVDQSTLATFMLGYGLTVAENQLLPRLAGAASRAIRRFCNRSFLLATFDELYTVTAPARTLVLREFPVSTVARCATSPTTALTIANTDTTTNYRATVALKTTGDGAAGLTPTGITLTRYASGVAHATDLLFGAGPPAIYSVQELVTQINAIGSGWSASVANSMGGWAVTDLRPVQGTMRAYGTVSAAALLIHADDLNFSLNERTGILTLGEPSDPSFDSPRWGPFASSEFQEVVSYGGRNGVRVVYTAGEAAVPPDVVLYCAEVVKAAIDRLRTDSALKSESDGTLSWSSRPLDELTALPPSVCAGLTPYINLRG